MSDSLKKLFYYLEFPFVRYALIVGLLIALCSSLLGVTLVLRRYSFIGDGLSHVAFGAMAIATVLHVADDTLIVLPITIVAAVILLQGNSKRKINGDAAIAMLSVGALAFGYLLLNVFSASANVSGDVCSTLFGSTSILTLTQKDVLVCTILSVVVILLFFMYYNRVFAITFDENFAKATGVNTKLYHILTAIIIAVIIVLGMKLVGSLLISALIIFPTLSAMRLMYSFRGVVIVSAVISVICALVGMLLSIMCSTPVGATIVVANIVVFALCGIVKK